MMAILMLDLLLLFLQVHLVVGLVPPLESRNKRETGELPCEFWNTKAGLTLIGAMITGLALLIIALTAYLLLSFQHSLIIAQIKARRAPRSIPSNRPCARDDTAPSFSADSPPSYSTIIRMDNPDSAVVLI